MVMYIMKKILVLAGLMLAAMPLFAQQVDRECADPHPAPSAPWQAVKQVELGWGTTDLRYQKNEVPTSTKKLELGASERTSRPVGITSHPAVTILGE